MNPTPFSFDVQSASPLDGTVTTGDFRVLVGVNAPDILTGQILPQGDKVLEAPIEVQVGIRINRISAVNSADENFTVIGNLRMDWTDPALAFSPDSCNCSVKLYNDKDVDRFVTEVGSRWPAFTFFNQLGNRWTQSRAAAIWPDGRARYAESFNTTFQADFDFRKYPFDTQTFPVFLDLLYPTSTYTMTELPGYSEIDPAHGEDELVGASSGIDEIRKALLSAHAGGPIREAAATRMAARRATSRVMRSSSDGQDDWPHIHHGRGAW